MGIRYILKIQIGRVFQYSPTPDSCYSSLIMKNLVLYD